MLWSHCVFQLISPSYGHLPASVAKSVQRAVCSNIYYSMPAALTVNPSVTLHVLQMIQEQLSIYFGVALDRHVGWFYRNFKRFKMSFVVVILRFSVPVQFYCCYCGFTVIVISFQRSWINISVSGLYKMQFFGEMLWKQWSDG